ncbi:MAG: HNH endonuclease, partial [Acidobacteria bacterium]
MGGYVAKVIERDGFRCQRPGCSNRTALTGSHVKSRGRGGSEEPENILTLCMVCHTAIERGLLKTTGRAPDQIQWE